MEEKYGKSDAKKIKKSILGSISNGGLEKTFPKKPSVYVFGAVTISVLAVLVLFFGLIKIADAKTCPTGQAPGVEGACEPVSAAGATSDSYLLQINDENTCLQSGGVWDENEGCRPQVGMTKTEGAISGYALEGFVIPEEAPVQRDKDCKSLSDLLSTNLFVCVAKGASWVILWVAAKFVFLAGVLFDFAIKISIYNVSQYFGSGGGVELVWGTIRDLGNIIFIFFLLWISIQTILGLDNAKKYLANIIITALLVNFSLFFTKVIIDTSNIIALQFYSGVVDPNCASQSYFEKLDGCVSDKLVSATGLATVFSEGKSSQPVEINFTNIILVGIFGTIFYLIVAFMLMQAAFMFIARTVALVLLAAISPLAFVLSIVPKTKKYADDWWKAVIDQALVAPIFLLFLWLIIKLTEGQGGALFSPGNAREVATGGLAEAITRGGGMNVVFGFFFLIGLLYFALKITKEYSGKFGAVAVEYGTKVVGGTTGWALRGTAGRLLNLAAQSEFMQRMGAQNTLGVGRFLHKAAIAGAGASFDVRGAGGLPLVGGALKQTGAAEGLGQPGGKGGFRAAEKAAQKADVEYAKELTAKGVKEAYVKDLRSMSLQERFITGRTKKSAAGAATEIEKKLKEEEQRKAEEERLKELNERILARDPTLQGATGMSAEELKEALTSSNEAMVKKFADVQEKLQDEIGKMSAEIAGAQTAAMAGDKTQGENVKTLTKQLNALNLTMRRLNEREKLVDKSEARRNRQEDLSRTSERGGGESKSKNEEKK